MLALLPVNLVSCFIFMLMTQLYIHLTHQNATQALDRLNTCLVDVKKWMAANKLKLNPDKNEFVVFGSKVQWAKLAKFFPVDMLGNSLKPADAVRNLGV